MGSELIDNGAEQAADEWIAAAPVESREAEYWAFLAGVAWASNRWEKASDKSPTDGECVLVRHYHRGVALAHYWESLRKWIIEGGVFDYESVSYWSTFGLPPGEESA